ncbi:MAG: RNA polymerase sigma factor [Chitinophagaceae bacterium]
MQHLPKHIVQQAQNGSREAFAQLYQAFSKGMFAICVRMTGNLSEAEDVLHDAFIKAFNQLQQLKDAQLFGGWLRTIVINECIRWAKTKKGIFSLENDATNDWVDETNEEAWWVNIDITLVLKEVKALPDGCREIFNLYVLENMSHKEIAYQLQITEGTSKSQYHRARKLLKEKLTLLNR